MSIVPELRDLVSELTHGPGMQLELRFAQGETGLDVRTFEVTEVLSTPWRIDIEAVSPDHHLDLGRLVGHGAGFVVVHSLGGGIQQRLWEGICTSAELVKTSASRKTGVLGALAPAAASSAAKAIVDRVSDNRLVEGIGGAVAGELAESLTGSFVDREDRGLSTYRLRIEHGVAQLRYRRDNRIFQGLTPAEIVTRVLARWNVEPELRLTRDYAVLEYAVQYGESDLDFVTRVLADAGISYLFRHDLAQTRLVLCDAPGTSTPRSPLRYNPDTSARSDVDHEMVAGVRLVEEMRATRVALRGSDFLVKADDRLDGVAVTADGEDAGVYESYVYDPHAFRFVDATDASGPSAARAAHGDRSAAIRLAAERRGVRRAHARSNSLEVAPGTVFTISEHPRTELADAPLLVTGAVIAGDRHAFTATLEGVFTDAPLVPLRAVAKPRMSIQTAIVVGPPGEEIHVDAFGRIKVQFHWDRDAMFDDKASCWVRVSHAVAGSAQGAVAHPRVGQEVLVDFVDSDPDQPIVVGRVYNVVNPPPYALPKHKAWSGIKTDTYPRSEGFNQLMFRDDRGKEQILVQAQRDYAEVVKNDQSSQVGRARSSHVGTTDALVVGALQTLDVGVQSVARIGVEQQTHVGRTRIATIGEHDYIEAGESFTVTTGAGTGVQISGSSQRIALTNGQASIVIDGPNVFIDAQNGIQLTGQKVVRADSIGGNVEINCGPTGVLGKPAGDAVAVCTIPEAVVPAEPGSPALGGSTSVAPYKHQAREQIVVPPSGYKRIAPVRSIQEEEPTSDAAVPAE